MSETPAKSWIDSLRRRVAALVRAAKDELISAGLDRPLRRAQRAVTGAAEDPIDALTRRIIAAMPVDAVYADVGAHKGVILDMMRDRSPKGLFHAFEPIPHLARILRRRYGRNPAVTVHETALSSTRGSAAFFVASHDLGYSGLRARAEILGADAVTPITVATERLDDVLSDVGRLDMIKIDTEGAEFDVLSGARAVIARTRPLILMEFGRGGADQFGVGPERMFDLLDDMGYGLQTIEGRLAGAPALDRAALQSHFETGDVYYFVAAPRSPAPQA